MPQAVEIHSGPLGEVRAASTAAGGTALTTTAAFVSFPLSRRLLVTLTPRNVVTAVVVQYALNPYLIVLKTTDALVAASNITDGSENVQDNDTTTTLVMNSFDTAANNNFLYVGSHAPFRGVRVIIGNTNSNAAVITVKYWNGTAWTNITATDGTISAGAMFGVTGNVTWTVPTAWTANSLFRIGDTLLGGPAILAEQEMYWTRWETSAAFDATVTVTGMQSMARSTAYGEFPVTMGKEFIISKGHHGTGCIEALVDAGTANLIVDCATMGVGSKMG